MAGFEGAKQLLKETKLGDFVARQGGKEVVTLPLGTSVGDALKVSWRWSLGGSALAASPPQPGQRGKTKLSFSVCCCCALLAAEECVATAPPSHAQAFAHHAHAHTHTHTNQCAHTHLPPHKQNTCRRCRRTASCRRLCLTPPGASTGVECTHTRQRTYTHLHTQRNLKRPTRFTP